MLDDRPGEFGARIGSYLVHGPVRALELVQPWVLPGRTRPSDVTIGMAEVSRTT